MKIIDDSDIEFSPLGHTKTFTSTNYPRILEDYQSADVKKTKKRLRYHHKLIILHEIVSDVKLFSHLKDTELAKDY